MTDTLITVTDITKYYPGTIETVHVNGTYDLKLDNNEYKYDVPAEQILALKDCLWIKRVRCKLITTGRMMLQDAYMLN